MKAGWKVLQVTEFAKSGAGGTPNKANKEFYEGGQIPWLLSGEVANANITTARNFITPEGLKGSSAKLFPPNSVLVAMYGATAGEVGILRFEAATNQAVCAILPNPSYCTEYLYYFLLHSKPLLVSQAVGNAQPNISQAKIKDLPVPLPPLEEQHQIVAVLDEAFEGLARARAHAEANLRDARELFASFLGSIFAPDSHGWKSAPLETLVEADCTLSYGIVQPGEEFTDGLPIVRPTDLGERLISLAGLKKIDPELAKGYSRTKLKGTEILLCVRGSTGVVSMATDELDGANVTRGIVPVRFDPKFINQQLGYYQFLSKPVQDQIKAGTYGAALMQINIRDLRQITFAVPPLAEQDGLVERLESVSSDFDLLIESYEKKIAHIDAVRQSLLRKAFAGELT